MENKKLLDIFSGALAFFGGAILFGMSMNMFLTPARVVMGGATGIATTVNYLVPEIPIGVMIILINVPLMLLNMKTLGFSAMIKTLVGIVMSSVMIDVLTFFPVTIDDPLLCSVIGGITMGYGSGLMLTRGFTTGGSDLAALMLRRHIKRLTTGRLILIIDVVVVVGSALITGNYEGIFYSALSIFTYSAAIDSVMGGVDKAKMAIIISKKHEEIAKNISDYVNRGVTVLYGRGWYTKEESEVIMCVVKRYEEFRIKTVVEKTDPSAFMIFTDATEVLGAGFKNITEEAPAESRTGEDGAKKKVKLLRRKKADAENKAGVAESKTTESGSGNSENGENQN